MAENDRPEHVTVAEVRLDLAAIRKILPVPTPEGSEPSVRVAAWADGTSDRARDEARRLLGERLMSALGVTYRTAVAHPSGYGYDEISTRRGESVHSQHFGAGGSERPFIAKATLLTDDERMAGRLAGELWNLLCTIVGPGPTRDADLGELVVHVHAIQQAVMSQAAGRAFPSEFRLLGKSLHPAETADVKAAAPSPADIAERVGQALADLIAACNKKAAEAAEAVEAIAAAIQVGAWAPGVDDRARGAACARIVPGVAGGGNQMCGGMIR